MVQVEMSEPDQFGQSHPKETREIIKAKLEELEAELANISNKEAYDQAKKKCPDQLKDDVKLAFLRCEVFNADKAAARLVKYWDKRLEIFGPDKAFLPLTQGGLFSGNDEGMAHGLGTVLPGIKGPEGRGVLLLDPSLVNASKFTRLQMLELFWYCVHALLEDEETQKKGMLCLVCPRHATFNQFDRKLDKMIMDSMKGCLPVRISCIAVCHPPAFFRVIWPIVKMFLGDRLRKRVKVMAGSDESVVKQLEPLGLTRNQVPELIGGTLKVDHVAWSEGRKKAGK